MEFEQSVTGWLKQWREGDDEAIERISALLYRDLKRLASHYLDGEKQGHTLQPTALVHEAFLHMSSIRGIDWQSRSHFIAVMAQTMRRILVDHARRRNSAKRDASKALETPEGGLNLNLDVLVVDQALTRLAEGYPRHAKVVELRFFGGLDSPEIAKVLDISLATVERDWRFARAWLRTEMSGPTAAP